MRKGQSIHDDVCLSWFRPTVEAIKAINSSGLIPNRFVNPLETIFHEVRRGIVVEILEGPWDI